MKNCFVLFAVVMLIAVCGCCRKPHVNAHVDVSSGTAPAPKPRVIVTQTTTKKVIQPVPVYHDVEQVSQFTVTTDEHGKPINAPDLHTVTTPTDAFRSAPSK